MWSIIQKYLSSFILRCYVDNSVPVKKLLAERFGPVQYLARNGMDANELGFVLGPVTEKELDTKLASVNGLNVCKNSSNELLMEN